MLGSAHGADHLLLRGLWDAPHLRRLWQEELRPAAVGTAQNIHRQPAGEQSVPGHGAEQALLPQVELLAAIALHHAAAAQTAFIRLQGLPGPGLGLTHLLQSV